MGKHSFIEVGTRVQVPTTRDPRRSAFTTKEYGGRTGTVIRRNHNGRWAALTVRFDNSTETPVFNRSELQILPFQPMTPDIQVQWRVDL